MWGKFLIVFWVVLLALNPLCTAKAESDLQKEQEILELRVRQLEEKLKKQERKASASEESQKELPAIVEALKAVEIGLSATGLIQGCMDNDRNKNLPSDKEREDRVDGSISAELEISKAIGDQGLATVILAGAYGDGIDLKIPSWWGMNGDAEGEQRVYVKELWYEQELLNGKLAFTLGKIDLTVYFDSNEVANDETTQFWSRGCVNSAAVEFPDDNGPGFRATFVPLELVDISLGWAEGDADWNELGQRSFFIGEVGFHKQFGELQGNYRFYGWYRRHHRDEDFPSWDDRAKGIPDCQEGWGFGISLDQAISSHISLFARVGYQEKEIYEFPWAWSIGGEVRGGYWNRGEDALGVAYGMAMISDGYEDFQLFSNRSWFKDNESHLELYYRFQLNGRISISPDIQILWNAQGDQRFKTVTVFGIRANIEF